jgi:outer membrane protein OmpA-like peptidoglycan-associated protein
MKKQGFFWVGYSDLMTSLFFIMLVLFVVSFSLLRSKYKVMEEQMKEIKNVEKALSELDRKYFEFDNINKRYKLKTDINFAVNKANIYDKSHITDNQRKELKKAGKDLFNKIKTITQANKEIDYLLIIEGITSRYKNNYQTNPDRGYKLSYERALALYNFWKQNNIDFRRLAPQCEIILAGSGYFSQSRDTRNEANNKRFTIQITSKVGKFIETKENERN